jgi:hypothetical protein
VFIAGCGHSGTTLMANMFAAHPDVYIPLRETGIFRTRNEAEAEAGFRELLREAEESGKPFLAEKTPRHIRRVSLIRSIVPGARFVAAVRDGRDVAASYARRTGEAQLGINQWIKSNAAIANLRNAEDLFYYRHEDLIEDPEATLRQICEFAGIPFSDQMLRYHEQDHDWFGQGKVVEAQEGDANAKYRNWQVNQPIFDNRGQWKATLHPDDFPELTEGKGLRLMRFFGYVD